MIRRIVHIVLTSFILFSNSGMVFAMNYCKEKLMTISLQYGNDTDEIPQKSCCKTSEEHKKCCEKKIITTNDDAFKYLVKSFDFQFSGVFFKNPSPLFATAISALKIKKTHPAFYVKTHAPPSYIRYCRLVFYA